jgi:uncharacterized protein (DUF1697 family)
MTQCIALLRGINVGRAKRIDMAELRELIVRLGFSDVRTLLNSGNVIFQAAQPDAAGIAAAIEAAIETRFGFTVPVIVLTADELNIIVAENTMQQAASDPSRFLVAFVANNATLAKARPLPAQYWSPEAISLGSKAAYLWCIHGVIESKLVQSFSRVTGGATTTRNWATVLKLHAAVAESQDAG